MGNLNFRESRELGTFELEVVGTQELRNSGTLECGNLKLGNMKFWEFRSVGTSDLTETVPVSSNRYMQASVCRLKGVTAGPERRGSSECRPCGVTDRSTRMTGLKRMLAMWCV